jgi:hypothetical protein
MTTRLAQTISLGTIGDFALNKLSAEIARLLKQCPRYGDEVATIVSEESVRRVQGRDSSCVIIPIATVEEKRAAANWAFGVGQKFSQWAAEVPEFASEFNACADFLRQIEAANRH